jgi:hypothetical protein
MKPLSCFHNKIPENPTYNKEQESDDERSIFEWSLLIGVIAIVIAYIAWITFQRTRIPTDGNIWTESPYLTNMLKIYNGKAFYGTPQDVNSSIYAPGLEYLSFAILRIFGKDVPLSIVAARYLNVVFGVLSGIILGITTNYISGHPKSNKVVVLSCGLMLIAVSRLQMFDFVHPDNLHILYTTTTFALTLIAIKRQSLPLIIAGITVGSVALIGKQTGGLLGIGAAISAFIFLHRSYVCRMLLLLYALIATAGTVWLLYQIPFARFYATELPAQQLILWSKLILLQAVIFNEYPFWLISAGAILAALILRQRDQTWTAVWCLFVFFGCMLPFVAFIKEGGERNNLSLLNLWFSLAWVALLAPLVVTRRNSAVSTAILLIFVYIGIPSKGLPDDDNDRYIKEINQAVAAAVEKRQRVLLTDGTTPLLAAGEQNVPLDRSSSYLDLRWAKKDILTGTKTRIEKLYYDLIMIKNVNMYGKEIDQAVKKNYVLVRTISEGPHINRGDSFSQVLIYEKRVEVSPAVNP